MSAVAGTHVGRVTQARVALSEWTKLRSVSSTRWSLATAFLLTIGIGALTCAVVGHHYPQMSARDKPTFTRSRSTSSACSSRSSRSACSAC